MYLPVRVLSSRVPTCSSVFLMFFRSVLFLHAARQKDSSSDNVRLILGSLFVGANPTPFPRADK